MFADSIRASSLNRLHKQAGQKTAPDQRHCVNFALATREPSTEDIGSPNRSCSKPIFSPYTRLPELAEPTGLMLAFGAPYLKLGSFSNVQNRDKS